MQKEEDCTKKNTIQCLTGSKKHDNIATVANTCNNYVTICNKNEVIEHNIVIDTC